MNFSRLSLPYFKFQKYIQLNQCKSMTVLGGTPGAGAGKGGGAGGTVRESGGGLGKFGAAQEEGYFYKKQKEQIKKIKQKLEDEKQQKKEE